MTTEGYRPVRGWVRAYKDDGTPHTEDDLGTGGIRNADGTLAMQARELKFDDGPEEGEDFLIDGPHGGGDNSGENIALGMAAGAVAAGVAVGAVAAYRHRETIATTFTEKVADPLAERWRKLRHRDETSAELTSLLGEKPTQHLGPTITRGQQRQLHEESIAAAHTLRRNAILLNTATVVDDEPALLDAVPSDTAGQSDANADIISSEKPLLEHLRDVQAPGEEQHSAQIEAPRRRLDPAAMLDDRPQPLPVRRVRER